MGGDLFMKANFLSSNNLRMAPKKDRDGYFSQREFYNFETNVPKASLQLNFRCEIYQSVCLSI